MSLPPPIRVLIVYDHRVVRAGIAAILGEHENFYVMGEAGTAAEALAWLPGEPDIALMDMRLPDGSGADACRKIKAARPATKVVMLTSFAEEALVFEAIAAGADGYLLRDSDDQALVFSLQTVAAGKQVLSPVVAQLVLGRARNQRETHVDPMRLLTPREVCMVRLVSEGCTYKEVGARLGIAEKTVRNSFSLMLDKLGIESRSQLIALYTRATSA